MKITFLGTGGGIPAKHRNVSSLALQLADKKGVVWLFDCGEATQHQILHTSLKPGKINKIFITHMHGDHIYGLPGLLGTRSFHGAETPLTVYGPAGIREFIEVSLRASSTNVRYPLEIKEIDSNGPIFEDSEYVVSSAKLNHGITSYGFRVAQKEQPGALLAEKLKSEGVPPGPLYKHLKKGMDVTLPDGRFIQGKDFLGPPKSGKTVTIIGDTKFTEKCAELAEKADILVHEATFKESEVKLAEEYFHSTALQAAETARAAGVKQLILNHISSRYQGKAVDLMLEEAREVFPETFIAEDLYSFTV